MTGNAKKGKEILDFLFGSNASLGLYDFLENSKKGL